MKYKAIFSIFFLWLLLMALISSLIVDPDPARERTSTIKKIRSIFKAKH